MASKSKKTSAPKSPSKSQKAKKQSAPKTAAKAVNKSAKDALIDAALSLAAVQAWEHCGVRDIATEAGLTIADFYDAFDDKNDLLVAYGRRLDHEVLASFAEPDYEANPRDRLFEILMERFDLANEHRDALTSIITSCKTDPKQVVIGLPHLAGSMTKMLEAAGLDTTGLRGAVRVAGLSAGILFVMRTWADDESEDLSKTMASLDKVLGNLEKAADTFGF